MMSPDDYLMLPKETADQRMVYGIHPEQFAELFLPAAPIVTPIPVIVLLHGGCWQARFDLAPMGQLARLLTADGSAVCNVEYRRIGNSGGWPMTLLDVATGVDCLRQWAPRYNLDVSSVITAGHSAGGHLALWLAGRHRLPSTSPLYVTHPMAVSAVVPIAGIADLALANRLHICRGAARTLLGGDEDTCPERYAQASPARLLPLRVPHHHLAGRDDRLVSPASIRTFVDEARQQGDDATIEEIDNCGHFELITAGTPAAAKVARTLKQLIAVDRQSASDVGESRLSQVAHGEGHKAFK